MSLRFLTGVPNQVNTQPPPAGSPRSAPYAREAPLIVSGGTASLNLTLAVCDYEHVRDLTASVRLREAVPWLTTICGPRSGGPILAASAPFGLSIFT